jgi:hypothetical protein
MKRAGLLFFIFIVCAFSNTAIPPQPKRDFEIKIHNGNQVEMCVSNYGKYGQAEDGWYGCWWPKGSGHNYIFGAGSWFGTIDHATGDTLVTIGYGPHGGESEYTPGIAGMSFSAQEAIIYMYPAPWPPPAPSYPMAPQDPISHQDSWCAYNDLDETYHMPGDTRPIGLEVYQSVYVWNLSTTEDIVFVRFELKNVSGDTLTDCYFGICADNAIGDEVPGNDIISGIVGRWYVMDGESLYVDNLGYYYQEIEEPFWNEFPGTLGYDYLQSPWDLPDAPGIADKDGDGIDDYYERDSVWFWQNHPPPDPLYDADLDGTPDWKDPSQIPQLGMTAFKRFTLNLEPNVDNERYITLAGRNFKTGAYEPFDTIPPDPDDQRFLQCSGPFDLESDSSVVILVGIIFAYWHDIYGRPDSALVEIDNTAQFIYDKNWLLPGPPPPPQLALIPGDTRVTLSWTSTPEYTADPYYDVVHPQGPLNDPYYREYDFEGYRIWRSLTGETGDWQLLASYDLFNGVVWAGDTTIPESIRIQALNTGIVHSYVDDAVRNGFTYYYAVTSWDYNFVKTIDGVDTFPSLIVFESGAKGEAISPRRDPANYVAPGEPVFTVSWGNERLVDIIDATVISPLEVDENRPVALEFAPPVPVLLIVDTDIDTIIGVRYATSLVDADGDTITTMTSNNVIGKSLHLDEFAELEGIAVSLYNGTDSFPNPFLVFDTVEVSGSYPDTLVGTVVTQIPSSAVNYCYGFWAHRGNDYQVIWKKKDASGPVNTVVVIDEETGDTIPYQPYQNDTLTVLLGEGWCFTKTVNFVTQWTTPVSDTLVTTGTPGNRTKALYINGGLVTLRKNQYMVDSILPGEGDVWLVRANREYTAAPVYGRVAISAEPGWFNDTTQLTLNVKVVPNPYLITNEWQISPQLRRLKFINLPNRCTIRIFNLNGELVKTIVHSETVDFTDQTTVENNAGGDEWWDLLSANRQLVSSGVYIFHVRSDVGEQVGKFVVIR